MDMPAGMIEFSEPNRVSCIAGDMTWKTRPVCRRDIGAKKYVLVQIGNEEHNTWTSIGVLLFGEHGLLISHYMDIEDSIDLAVSERNCPGRFEERVRVLAQHFPATVPDIDAVETCRACPLQLPYCPGYLIRVTEPQNASTADIFMLWGNEHYRHEEIEEYAEWLQEEMVYSE